MKKSIILLLTILNLGITFAQEEIQLSIAVGSVTSTAIDGNWYQGTSISMGPQLSTNKGSMRIYGAYEFSGVSGRGSLYDLQNHLIGGGFHYRILSKERKFSPYIEVSALREVATNYQNGMLDDDLIPRDEAHYGIAYPGATSNYRSSFYVSTPFVGHFLVGCDVRIAKGLNLNFGLGYGIKYLNYKRGTWQNSPTPSPNDTYRFRSYRMMYNMLDVKLGLSYAISFKKRDGVN